MRSKSRKLIKGKSHKTSAPMKKNKTLPDPRHSIRMIALVLFLVLLNIGCDQGTKDYARKNIRGRGTINVIGSFFILRYAENDGAFLSMGSDMQEPYKTVLLVIFPIIMVIGGLGYLIFDKKLSLAQIICISFIIGGGISNLSDRILNKGLVTDFMNFGIGPIRTGILNFADLSITFGVIFLILFQRRTST